MSSISDERVSEIVSQVRLNLNMISQVDLKDRQIYKKANRVQNDIILKTKCVESALRVDIKKNIGDYDIIADHPSYLKSYETSWGGKLFYKELTDFLNTEIRSGYPSLITLFNNTLKIKPVQTTDCGHIIFYYYPSNVINKMDADVPPEIPYYADTCLIFGICAQFNPKEFMAEYLSLIEDIKSKAHIKHGFPRTTTDNYVWDH